MRATRPPALLLGALAALVSACAAPRGGSPRRARRGGAHRAPGGRGGPAAPGRSASPGQFRYLRWTGATVLTAGGPSGEFSRLEYRISERWARPDGSGRWRATCYASVFVGPRDRARGRAAGSPRDRYCAQEDESAGPGMLAPGAPLADRLDALPTNPARLETRLRAAARPSERRLDDGQMFALLGELLQVPEGPPRLRAGLIRVASRLGGVEVADGVYDAARRPGVALRLTVGGLRHELILSARTAAVLGQRTVIEAPVDWADAPPGHALGWVAYLDSAAVYKIPTPLSSPRQEDASGPRGLRDG